MKIGLITFHETTNFGSFLQTYGLYKAINDMGHECDVIDYKCESIVKRELPKTKPESYSIRNIAKYLLVDKMLQKKYAAFQKLLYSSMRLSKPYYKNDIGNVNQQYEAFVAGSDILWNLHITDGDMTYFLDFVDDSNKKYAFSTSIGEPWEENDLSKIIPLLCDFQRIALREEPSKACLSDLLGKKVEAVCDPTMLLEPQVWERFIVDGDNSNDEYVLTYFNDDQMLQDAKDYARMKKCRVLSINYGLPIKGVKNIHPYSVAEFLSLIKNAKAVFTASYHGMLFSAYFEVPFYCYMRKNGNNVRFQAVLDRLNLWQCCREDGTAFSEVNIDYTEVTKSIEAWRKESLSVLSSYWRK